MWVRQGTIHIHMDEGKLASSSSLSNTMIELLVFAGNKSIQHNINIKLPLQPSLQQRLLVTWVSWWMTSYSSLTVLHLCLDYVTLHSTTWEKQIQVIVISHPNYCHSGISCEPNEHLELINTVHVYKFWNVINEHLSINFIIRWCFWNWPRYWLVRHPMNMNFLCCNPPQPELSDVVF